MASLYPNGLDGSTDELVTNAPFYGLDCVVWYVNSDGGVDGASPAGRDPEAPLATVGQAYTNASANDVIVLMDGHAETRTSGLSLAKRGLVIVGCGQTAGAPNVELTNNSSNTSFFLVDAENIQIRNITFKTNTQACSAPRISVAATGCHLNACRFECGEFDDTCALRLNDGTSNFFAENVVFVSIATSLATRPESGMKLNDNAVVGIRLRGVTVDDGAYGWTNSYGIDLSAQVATDLMADSISLLRGASIKVGSGATGYIIPTATGGGLVDI